MFIGIIWCNMVMSPLCYAVSDFLYVEIQTNCTLYHNAYIELVHVLDLQTGVWGQSAKLPPPMWLWHATSSCLGDIRCLSRVKRFNIGTLT